MPASSRPWTTALALAACALALAGCSSEQLGRTFGLIHDAPDEYTVTTRAPLAMPPSFTLSTPTPGVPRPQEQSERAEAEQALVPQTALGTPAAGTSAGQQALVQEAGPPAPANIRTQVDQAALNRPSESFVNKLMFWRTPPPPGIVVDPQKEAQRIRENAALGQSQETGETPIIQPKSKGWLEDLF